MFFWRFRFVDHFISNVVITNLAMISYSPLLKVCAHLLLMGVMSKDDYWQLMVLIDPRTVDDSLETGEKK